MRLDLRSGNIEWTSALRAHLERRLQFALGRFGARVDRVSARIMDVNGNRGGADKSCRLTLRLDNGHRIWIEETQADLYAAIDRAADRLGENAARQFRLSRQVRHAGVEAGWESTGAA
jgi:ribosomal subunit interface protein